MVFSTTGLDVYAPCNGALTNGSIQMNWFCGGREENTKPAEAHPLITRNLLVLEIKFQY